MKKYSDMTQGTPWKILLSLALPMMLGYMFNQLYSMVDGIIVGQALGVNALAAVGATGSLNNLFCSIVMGTTVAAGIVVGQYLGSGNHHKISQAIANVAYLNLFCSVFLEAGGIIFAKPLLVLFNTPETILTDATLYMQLYLAGILFMTVFYGGFGILRSFGDAKTPLYFMIVSSLVNIVLDLLFIYVFSMGVAGAALATTLAQGIACILCMIYCFKTNEYFAGVIKYHDFDSKMFLSCAKIGLSLGMQQALVYLSTSILQAIINGYGEITIAAFTATTKLEQFVQQPVFAWANAMTAYASQNIGANKPERIKEAMKSTYIITAIFSIVVLALFVVAGKYLVGIFVSNQDVIDMGRIGLMIEMIFVFGLAIGNIIRNILTSAGDAVFPMISGVVEIITRVALCFLLTSISFIDVWGIWLTTGLTWAVTALVAYIRYKQGKWQIMSLVD